MTTSRQTSLPLSVLRLDGNTQARASMNEVTVQDYVEAMTTGVVFPAVTAFFDGTSYWLADGFHRVAAAARAGLLEIPADVCAGTRDDCIWYATAANRTHGLPRSNEDKRRAVIVALQSERGRDLSDRAIAEHVGVTHTFVAGVRRQLVTVTSSSGDDGAVRRVGLDGKRRARRSEARDEETPPRLPASPEASAPPVSPPSAQPEAHQPQPAPLTLLLVAPTPAGDRASHRRRRPTFRRALGAVLSMSEDEQLALCNDVVARVVGDGEELAAGWGRLEGGIEVSALPPLAPVPVADVVLQQTRDVESAVPPAPAMVVPAIQILNLLAQVGVTVVATPTAAPPQLLTAGEIAAALGVSKWSVFRWAAAGRIPCICLGRKRRFELAAVVDSLRRAPTVPGEPAPMRATRPTPAARARPALGPKSTSTPRPPDPKSLAERLRDVVAATKKLSE